MRRLKMIVGGAASLMCALMSCVAPSEEFSLVLRYTAPPEAENVNRMVLREHVAEQISYLITAAFPSMAAMQLHREQLSQNGYVRCNGSDDDWHPHLDSSGDKRILIHEISDYWIDRDRNLFAIISASYNSESQQPGRPDNSRQQILLRIEKSDNADAELTKLNIDCSLGEKKNDSEM